MTRQIGGASQSGTDMHISTVTPVLTSSTDDSYVANDFIGTSTLPITFENVVEANGRSGFILGCTLIDDALQSVVGELWLFDTTFTAPADSAAWTVTDAFMETFIGVIPFSTYYASAANSASQGIPAAPLPFKCGSAVNDIYGAFVTRGAPNYDIDSLTFRLYTVEA